MKKMIFSLVFIVSLPLSAHGEIHHYSASSWLHITQYSALGAAIAGGLAYLATEGSLDASGVSVTIGALIGGSIGYVWSSCYVNEECLNSAYRLLEDTQTKRLMDLMLSTASDEEIMKSVDRLYARYQYSRLAMMNELIALQNKLVSNQYYLKRAIQDERRGGNQYLVQKGSEYAHTIEQYIAIIAERYCTLKNDLVYLAQLSADRAAKAEEAAQAAQTQAFLNSLRR